MKKIILSLVALTVLAAATLPAEELVPLKPKLPAPAFIGTPKDIPAGSNIEPPSTKPRPP